MSNLQIQPNPSTDQEPTWVLTEPMAALFNEIVYGECKDGRRKLVMELLNQLAEQLLERQI